MNFTEEFNIVQTERKVGIWIIISVALFTLIDIAEDLHEGSSWLHMGIELVMMFVCIGSVVYLWRRIKRTMSDHIGSLREKVNYAQLETKKFRENHLALAKGISEAIDKQLVNWGLSIAEREIAFLLIKGLSFKEIGEIRSTSEHTVRQQAATIYRKSGLEGRTQLSAYFLEDILDMTGS